jgi:hypothetical protein
MPDVVAAIERHLPVSHTSEFVNSSFQKVA